MEILTSVVGKICEYLAEPIARRAGYLVCYNSHKKKLQREAKDLEGIKSRVGHRVDEARWKGELIQDDVIEWCPQVDDISKEVNRFFEDEVQVNKRCLGGWCPDLIYRYWLGKKAKKMTEAVIGLKTRGAFVMVSYRAPPLGIEHMATGDFTDFESRKERMDEIMAALKDDNIKAIGICGLGGVGKTTAVKEAGNRANVEKLFDVIVMAVVTQTPDLIAIQDEIAEMLNLKLEAKSLSVRAGKLRNRLLNYGRVLVILDDVWMVLQLEEIGIPFGPDHKGCKLMLTSRNQDACNRMRTCKNITIGVLVEEESWNLFKQMAGESIESPDLRQIATDVLKECGGLPIAIVTVGMALKDKTEAAMWRDALHQLKQSSPKNIPKMNEKVYRSLELSFNFLESQEAKSCLLLCCIFKEDTDIPLQDLIRYGMGLCLFEVEDLVQATDRVHTLVHGLKNCYLLLDSKNKECVKMHDVVRNVIRSIATAGKAGLMLRHGLELEWPTESTRQLYTSTSFMSNKILHLLLLELKEWPKECVPMKLQQISQTMALVLSLEEIGDSVKVPENLFEGMKELRVLRLRRMFIPSPPPSLALLTKLQTLCIEDCNLKNISLIGELKTLKILSFCGSSIQELPMEIGKLTHLRSLDLTGCSRLERISPGVFSSLIRLEHLSFRGSFIRELPVETRKLTHLRSLDLTGCERLKRISPEVLSSLIRLEQLYMRYCGVQWEVEEGIIERNNVNVAELKSLSDQLTALEIELPASSAKFLGGFKNLVRFYIQIGHPHPVQFRNQHVRNELIINLDRKIPVDSWINIDQLLKKTEILHFQERSVKNILNSLDRESLAQLKSLHVYYCNELEYVVDTVDLIPQGIFPILDTLDISRVRNLKMICHGQLPAGSFAELREIHLGNCKRLENVFSQSIAKGLVQLEILEITDCEMMEEIVVTEREHEEVSSKIRFPKLRYLSFDKLPSLIGFCKKMGDEIEFPQLSTLYLRYLPKLRSIWPSSQGSHESDDSATATQHLLNQKVKSLCELRSITVNHCEKLANVFSSDSIQSLQNLEEIYISNCDSVEVALDFVGVNIEEGLATAPLGRLKKFELSDLPKLICVWKKLPKRIHECQKLQSLKIVRCSRLKNVFSPSTTKIAEQLQVLEISECEMMTEIVVEDEGDEKATDKIEFLQLRHLSLSKLPNLLGLFNEKVKSLCELRYITVNHCEKLANVFSSDSMQSLQNLEEIYVRNCDSLEVVLDFVGVNIKEGLATAPLGRLKKFELSDLPKLICVWKKLPKRIHECQKLRSLKIVRCSRLKNVFSPSTTKIAEQLQVLEISECEMMTEIVVEDEGDEKATDKIEFLQLHHLSLSKLPNLLGLFNEKVKSLCELRSITANHCEKLANVFSSDSMQSLQNLEEIYVRNCDSLEVVLDFVGVNIKEGLATAPLGRLKKFELSDLPKLICVWKKLPKRIHDCQKLESLKIVRCSRLKNVFSPSTTKIAEQLQVLEISECEMMTKIVVEDERDEKTTDKIEFLQLRHLSLSMLPNLLGLFPKEVGSAEIHLFNEKVSFPRLENLTVSYMENFGEIWCSEPPSCSFYELRILNVTNCHKILHVAPFHLLKRLQNLEEVRVESCDSVEEVFEFIGPSVEEGHAVMLSRLERIFLASLPKLMQICKKDHNRTIGFQNLKHLKVFDCGSLRNLFDPSMTRGLVQLQHLEVIGCEMMEEIVAKGEEQEEGRMDKIVIPKLEYLSLYGLQNLTSFCQSLYAFDLPLLDVVGVEYCPNMKTFSSGFASTPKLKEVRIRNREENLMGDLNNTIQQLFQTQTSEPEEDEDEDEDDSEDECNSGSNSEEIDDVEAKNDGASSLKMEDAVARLSDSQGTPMELKVNQETLPQENDAQRDQSPN